jgi:beta-glucosidase
MGNMIQFPPQFFWGAATSAHQVEGNNINNDWWAWEKEGVREHSGDACRHYELYGQDFDIAKSLNHNAHRLSIEWSRIEPQEGVFSPAELDHYAEVISALRQRGLEPIVTLYHFTLPLWLAHKGGWLNPKSPAYFLRFVDKVVQRLGDKVSYWVTINEPLVYVYYSYILGDWPPQRKSFIQAIHVTRNLIRAHVGAFRLIKLIYGKKGLPQSYVSIAKNMQAFVPCRHNLKDSFAVILRDRLYNFNLIEKLIRHKTLDFIGVNYYSRNLAEVKRWGINNLLMDVCQDNHHPLPKNSMGWDIYPQGLYDLLIKLKRYHLPVFILENGIATDDDSERWRYIEGHLMSVARAIGDGVGVMGYIHWSLLDNYEWDKGFGPHFGLVHVDYHTYQRTIKESAGKFAAVCRTGRLTQ